MDFREVGRWLYSMVGPQGERHWSGADYESMPAMRWQVAFDDNGGSTTVSVVISFSEVGDLEKMLKRGSKEGFTAGLENLDVWLSSSRLR